MRKRVTIADLAKELGLAKSAVSYALNDLPGVSDATKQRVKALAAERGWQPSSAARALSRGKADTIGLVLGREPALLAEEPWYQLVIVGVEEVLIEADYSLMLRMVGIRDAAAERTYRDWAVAGRVDGVILFDGEDDDWRLPLLRDLALPAVLVGWRAEGFPCVVTDGQREATLIVRELERAGVEEVLFVGGPDSLLHEQRRAHGLKEAAVTGGLSFSSVHSDYSFDGAHSEVGRCLRNGRRPGAIVCSNDVMATASLNALESAGLRVPEDCVLVSWDDSFLTRNSRPPISALDRGPQAYGRAAARLLLREIAGRGENEVVRMPVQMQVRASLGQGLARE